MQSLCTTLNCVWQAGSGQSQFEVRNFVIESDQYVKAYGNDQCGGYQFVGRVEKSGQITLTRTYANLPHVMPLCFQGTIQDDSSIVGQVINGGILAGTFTFQPCFRKWEGYAEDSSRKIQSLNYFFNFVGNSVYGYGIDRQGLYVLKGGVDSSTQKMILSEFRFGQQGVVYEGKFDLNGAQGSLNGSWKNGGTGASGIFQLSQYDPNQGDIPLLNFIDSKAPDVIEHSLGSPIATKEHAKPFNKGKNVEAQVSPPANFSHPQPQMQVQTPMHQGYSPSHQQLGQYQMPVQQPMYAQVMNGFYAAPTFVDSNLLSNCSNIYGVQEVAGQIAAGLAVQTQDLLIFYRLCTNNPVKLAMTNTVYTSLVGMNPANYYLAVKHNSDSQVQLAILQNFGQYVRGMLTPEMKQHMVDLVVFNKDQETARAILSQI